jgi:hypothetical protein
MQNTVKILGSIADHKKKHRGESTTGSRRNPVYKWGAKNHDCPYFEACFSQAFNLRWDFWSCSKCANQHQGMGQGNDYTVRLGPSDTHPDEHTPL